MKAVNLILGFAIILLLSNCKSSTHYREAMEPATAYDSIASSGISSSAAVVGKTDSTRKFIRTADIKFRVRNVLKTTYQIENIASQEGGFVTSTNLSSNVEYVKEVPISRDSAMEFTYFTVNNAVTLRIPVTQMDTVLRQIARDIEFLDYRNIKAEDVALRLLSNKLTETHSNAGASRIDKYADKDSHKLDEEIKAEELKAALQEKADHARISNLELLDQINFCTINIEIYQRRCVKQEKVISEVHVKPYKPGFGSRFIDSIKTGWNILEEIIIFLANLWAILAAGITIYLVVRYYLKRSKK
jgi:hypothetical protein